MKKIAAFLLAMMMVLSLTACGENEKNPSGSTQQSGGTNNKNGESNGNNGVAIKDVSTDNWAQVLKENFGIEITLPDGWTVKEVSSPNGYSNVKLFFNVGGSDTYDIFGERLFAACKTASTKGDMDKATFADSVLVKGTSTWHYYPDLIGPEGQSIKYVRVNYFDNRTNVEMTFQR